VVVDAAGADGEHGALLRLLGGGVGDDDARGRRRLGLVGLHDDAVLERLDADLGSGHVSMFSLKGLADVRFGRDGWLPSRGSATVA
jgi:hypothetical protein